MDRSLSAVAALSLLLLVSPAAAAPPEGPAGHWSAALLSQTDDVPALATGVAVGPSSAVALGGMTCERTPSDDFGRCWGQPWISRDGSTWEAVEARTSGLELGRFQAATSGPEVGVEGVAYGPGGFVAFGWAASQGSRRAGTGPSGVTPALWRSDDGSAWERLRTPRSFLAEGPMVSGAWPLTIAGSASGYLLGGTLFDTPTPRGAIWASPDGRSWTLTGPAQAFDIGSYVDTLEIPAAGGIAAIAVAGDGSPGAGGAIAVGEACPGPARFARPKGAWAKAFQWTPGDCASRVWHSEDGLTWSDEPFRPADGADLAPVPYEARTVATTGERTIVGVAPERVLVSDDGRTWDVADGEVGRHLALASLDGRFYALVPECTDAECQRRGLALWTSDDGASWSRHPSQPALPVEAQDFVSVDVAAAGDRLMVTAGYFAVPYGELTSAAMVSPVLAAPGLAARADSPSPEPRPDGSPGALVTTAPSASATATLSVPATAQPAALITLPPADAAPLPETASLPAIRLAYVADAASDRPTIRELDLGTGEDRLLARGSEPSWSPDGASLAHDCEMSRRDATTSSICTVDVATGATQRVVARAWGPRWSPDGDSLAYSRSRIDMGDAWVGDLASGAATSLPGSQPVWSPVDDWLLVTTGSGVPIVTIVRPDGTDERVLGPGWSATWSPDGRHIASAWADEAGTTVSAMDVAIGETAPLFTVEGSILSMAWLPGDVMAIVAGGTGGGDLYAIDLADGTVRSLTSEITLAPGSELAVSPDGRWLAFSATGPAGGTDVYVAALDGGWRQVTTGGDALDPTWAP